MLGRAMYSACSPLLYSYSLNVAGSGRARLALSSSCATLTGPVTLRSAATGTWPDGRMPVAARYSDAVVVSACRTREVSPPARSASSIARSMLAESARGGNGVLVIGAAATATVVLTGTYASFFSRRGLATDQTV